MRHSYARPLAAADLSPLERVVWSIAGAAGTTEGDETPLPLALASRYPKIIGVQAVEWTRSLIAEVSDLLILPVPR